MISAEVQLPLRFAEGADGRRAAALAHLVDQRHGISSGRRLLIGEHGQHDALGVSHVAVSANTGLHHLEVVTAQACPLSTDLVSQVLWPVHHVPLGPGANDSRDVHGHHIPY